MVVVRQEEKKVVNTFTGSKLQLTEAKLQLKVAKLQLIVAKLQVIGLKPILYGQNVGL
jgi:hypothetical protein